MTSEIATIKFSGGAEEGSSSDESSEGFEVTTQLKNNTEQMSNVKTNGKTLQSISSGNPFDCDNAGMEFNETTNPFHKSESMETQSKNPFDIEEPVGSGELKPFDENTDEKCDLEKGRTFHGKETPTDAELVPDIHERIDKRNLFTANRFNPFDTDADVKDEDEWWENQITGRDVLRDKGAEKLEVLDMSEDHFSLPEAYMSMSSVSELEQAIASCKEVVLQCVGQSDKQKEMVNKLIQLRLKLIEAKEGPQEPDPDVKHVVGHKFMKKENSSTKHYCEKCNTMIWGVLQHWYRCTACGFCVHDKCLNLITRTCASVQVEEHAQYVLSICPERGLSTQNYKCTECRRPISYQAGFGEPRQCDYTGNFYCDLCHWNDQMSIPARIVHNWDFEPRKVCRASKQFLKLMCKKPVLRIQDINPMLFSFVEELNQVKKLREEILIMKKYFLSCKLALKSKLLLLLVKRQHFVENSDMYSLQDLLDTASDLLMPELTRIHASFAQHIKTDCQICQGKGFVCELCDYKEILFPFDNHAIVCAKCSTVLHRHCLLRRNQQCPKCERMNKRSVGDDSP